MLYIMWTSSRVRDCASHRSSALTVICECWLRMFHIEEHCTNPVGHQSYRASYGLGGVFRDVFSNVTQRSKMKLADLQTLLTCSLKDSVSSTITPKLRTL